MYIYIINECLWQGWPTGRSRLNKIHVNIITRRKADVDHTDNVPGLRDSGGYSKSNFATPISNRVRRANRRSFNCPMQNPPYRTAATMLVRVEDP